MKKRLLALLCMVVMVVGIFAVAATNAKATGSEVTYEVGYAKVSISPWADRSEGATSTTLLSGIKFAGYGSTENRYTDTLGIIDDNGDGNKDRDDGLFATCTVVTEFVGGTEGKTLVFFTMDTLNGYEYITTDMRQYVPSVLSGANVVANQIMVSGSHNHTGPMVNNLRTAYRTEWNAAVEAAKEAGATEPTYLDFVPNEENSDKQSVYYKYILDQMLSAAQTAYNDREVATISTKSVVASEVTGKKMNYIRHYNTEYRVVKEGWFSNSTMEDSTAVMGSNFGFSNGASFGGSLFADIKGYIDSQEHIADAEDTLQLVKFDVADSEGKDDIVFVTWQAHPDNVGYAGLSSDYIGGLRYRMENNNALSGSGEDYRVAFFQGAAGNLVASSQSDAGTEWTSLTADGIKNSIEGVSSTGTSKGFSFNQYGYLMGQVALSGLENDSSWKSISGGIRNMQTKYAAEPTVFNEAEIAAAADYYTNGGTFPYAYTHTYTDGTTETVVLNSIHHANHINTVKNSREGTTINMELNAIILGDGANSLAFVTAPGEMFDRYNNEDVYSYDDSATSGWASIANASTYGTPIIMGYSNAATGYVPNRAAFHYNEKQGQTGVPASEYLGIGSYEANTSNYEEGTGEAMMGEYKTMLTQTAGLKQECEHCGEEVEFAPLAQGGVGSRLVSGHYYLTENITNSTGVTIGSNNTVCLDLNGWTWSHTYGNTVFTVGTAVDPTSVLNIMDSSKGAGTIQTKARALYVRGTVNLYSGNIKTTATEAVADGDTIYISGGTVNQHGGTIYGGKTTSYGGAIRFWKGTFNMYDGYVFGGTAERGAAIANLAGTVNLEGGEVISGVCYDNPADTKNEETGEYENKIAPAGECIWTYDSGESTVVKLSGAANVEDIYVPVLSAVDIQLTDDFNGKINSITFADVELTEGKDLGTRIDNAQINASIPVIGTNSGTFYLGVLDSNLVATATDPNTVTAWIGDTTYEAMDAAIEAYDEGEIIKLNKDITYNFTKTVYLDLNGHNANVTASSGTVYVLDSATDDYKGSYGSVTGTGDIQPATDTNVIPGKDNWYSAYSAYIAVEEQDGSKSYHRVDLGIKDTVALPGTEDLGIYYDFGLYVDATLKDKITSYGVAVSTKGDPVENGALKEDQGYPKTELTTFAAGSDGNVGKSSTITNIMKQSYGYAANKRNAASKIYGRAYMVLDGNYVFAPCAENSLKSTVQAINNKWSDLTEVTQTPVLDYYNAYKSVMKPWSLGNITTAAEAAEAEEEAATKVLIVGNSHSMDAMWMLYEVYEQRRAVDDTLPELELGILYYSGCHIDQHVDFAKNDLPAYEYYKINEEIYNRQSGTTRGWERNGRVYATSSLNTSYPGWTSDSEYVHIICDTAKAGTYVTKNGWTLRDGLQDEQWDKVILQESANYIAQSGMSNITNGDLDWLVRFVKTNAKVLPQLSFHVNWAAPMDDDLFNTSGDAGRVTNFDRWFGDGDGAMDEDRLAMQRLMTQRIIANAKNKFASNTTYANVINSGVAVHHAFENYLGTNATTNENMAEVNAVLYRDYTHLSDYGRLIVANLWFEELFGDGELTAEEVVTEIPSKFYIAGGIDMTDDLKTLLINAVNYALDPETAYVNPWTE